MLKLKRLTFTLLLHFLSLLCSWLQLSSFPPLVRREPLITIDLFSTSCQCYFKTESWGVVSSHFHICVSVVCWVGPALVISFHKRAKLLLQSLLFGRAWIYVLHCSLTSDKCTIWGAVLAFHACVCFFYHSYLTADKDLSNKPQADRQFPVVLNWKTTKTCWFQMAVRRPCHTVTAGPSHVTEMVWI